MRTYFGSTFFAVLSSMKSVIRRWRHARRIGLSASPRGRETCGAVARSGPVEECCMNNGIDKRLSYHGNA